MAAFALGAWWLGRQSFWLDEGFSAALTRGPVSIIFGGLPYLPAREPNPPFYYLLLAGWRLAAGSSEYGMRFLSVVPTVLAMPVLFKVGQRLGGRRLGLIAAAIAATNPFLIWMAQEARAYSWVMLWSLLGMYFLIKGARGGGKVAWLCFALANLLAVFSHIYAVFVVVAEALALLRCRKAWLPGALSIGGVALAFGVWFVPVIRTPGETSTWRAPIDFWDMLRVLSRTFASQVHLPDAVDPWYGFALGLLAVVGLVLLLTRSALNFESLLVVLWLIMPLVLVYALSYRVPLFSPRYFIVIVPAFVLLLAIALTRLPTGASAVALVGVLALSTWAVERGNSVPAYGKEDYRLAASYVGARSTPNDAILIVTNYIVYAFDYYFHGAGQVTPLDIAPDSALDPMLAPTAKHDHVWLVEAHDVFVDPQDRVGKWLRSHYVVADEKYITGIHFIEFDTKPTVAELPAAARPSGASLGPVLAGYELQPGALAKVTLYWKGQPTQNYHLSIKLWGPNGKLGGQQDGEPLNAGLPFSKFPGQGLVRDEHFVGASPGVYDVRLSVYLPGQPDTGQVDLGTVRLG